MHLGNSPEEIALGEEEGISPIQSKLAVTQASQAFAQFLKDYPKLRYYYAKKSPMVQGIRNEIIQAGDVFNGALTKIRKSPNALTPIEKYSFAVDLNDWIKGAKKWQTGASGDLFGPSFFSADTLDKSKQWNTYVDKKLNPALITFMDRYVGLFPPRTEIPHLKIT